MKIVKTYQQTYCSDATPSYAWSFRWGKLYKQNENNKFRIKVNCLATNQNATSPKPHLFFLQNLATAIPNMSNASIMYRDVSTTPVADNPVWANNDWFLGVLGGGFNAPSPPTTRGDIWIVSSIDVVMDDLPMDFFRIYYRHPDTATSVLSETTVLAGFFISFEITEFNDDD
tara:strand:- start:13287 stop:13802 length:516 start_codon:yes stop_codon:yes gene_type:complete